MRNNSWQLKTTLHKNSWRLATNKPSMMRTRFIFCSHGLTQEQSVKCINLLYTQCTIGFEFGWNISVAVFKDWCSSTQQSWPSVMVMGIVNILDGKLRQVQPLFCIHLNLSVTILT